MAIFDRKCLVGVRTAKIAGTIGSHGLPIPANLGTAS